MAVTFGLLEQKLASTSTGIVGNLLEGLAAFAIIVLVLAIGWVVAWALGFLLRQFLHRTKVEHFMKDHGVDDALLGFTVTGISVILLKLAVMITFLGIAADIVNIPILSALAIAGIIYIPHLVEGVIILAAALIAGDYLTDRLKTMKSIPFANLIAILIEVFIAYNAIVIALPLLLPSANPRLLEVSFVVILSGIVLAFSLGAAIAIGLGLKDTVGVMAKKKMDKFHKLL
jgi:hypothetical protein